MREFLDSMTPFDWTVVMGSLVMIAMNIVVIRQGLRRIAADKRALDASSPTRR